MPVEGTLRAYVRKNQKEATASQPTLPLSGGETANEIDSFPTHRRNRSSPPAFDERCPLARAAMCAHEPIHMHAPAAAGRKKKAR